MAVDFERGDDHPVHGQPRKDREKVRPAYTPIFFFECRCSAGVRVAGRAATIVAIDLNIPPPQRTQHQDDDHQKNRQQQHRDRCATPKGARL